MLKKQVKKKTRKKRIVNVMKARAPFMRKFAKTAQGFGHSRGS